MTPRRVMNIEAISLKRLDDLLGLSAGNFMDICVISSYLSFQLTLIAS
jgi:hypothetical protein